MAFGCGVFFWFVGVGLFFSCLFVFVGFIFCWGWIVQWGFLLVGWLVFIFLSIFFKFFFFNQLTSLICKSLYCTKQFFVTLYPVEELTVIKTLTQGLFSMTLTSFETQILFRLSNSYTQYSSYSLILSLTFFSPLLLS